MKRKSLVKIYRHGIDPVTVNDDSDSDGEEEWSREPTSTSIVVETENYTRY